jgi:hypothetical protein
VARKTQHKVIFGLWGGENTGDDASLIDDLESSEAKNIEPSSEGGILSSRIGRRLEPNLTQPITSEWDTPSGTSGGRINGLHEHTDKRGGTFLIVTHAKGVDYVERRGPVLYITTWSPLATGTSGSAYSDTVTCKGGKSTYTWSLFAGALPTGLALAGSTTSTETISGTPSADGTFIFTLAVEDSSIPTQKAYKRFTIVIAGGGA